ncbi:MAG: tagatose 1,6-diphosphate aldolase [Anaerolineae bacterium]|nr:tagatose 1,6-diphosphate aldolase [Anaerolineae bacterium]
MRDMLTPGKWRGLKACSSDSYTFSILAFDQRGNYRIMLPEDATFAQASQIKAEVVSILAPQVTAVLLDPVYGLDAALAMPGGRGLLMALEKTGYAGSPQERRIDFIPGWDVGMIRAMGASAVKLLVYYHPDAGAITDEIDGTIMHVAAECRSQDIPLFVEPLSYSINAGVKADSAEFAADRPRIVRETAYRLSRLGVDVLKLEFPVNVAHDADESVWRSTCEAVSKASSVPWTLLSAGVNFDAYTRQVTVACKAGASGFVGGRAIWKEAIPLSPEARATFLNDEGARRVERLRKIVERDARPWTDFYAPPGNSENWHEIYRNEIGR